MSVYAVFLNEPDPGAWAALKERWPGRTFELTEHMAFVAPENDVTLTSHIGDAAGIGNNDGEETTGIVLEVTAHHGYNRSDLWEWLRKVQS